MTDSAIAETAPAAAPPVAAGETKTFTLAVPITDDAGVSYATLTLVEPEVRHDKIRKTTDGSVPLRRAAYVAALSSVPIEALRRIKFRDLNPIMDWLNEIEHRGVIADLAVEVPLIEALVRADLKIAADEPLPDQLPAGYVVPQLPLEGSRVFDLAVPIVTNAAPIAQLTVREPDLEAGITAEKLKASFDQTTALIATLSGQVIPIISRMKLRDYRRIENWVSRFLPDGNG